MRLHRSIITAAVTATLLAGGTGVAAAAEAPAEGDEVTTSTLEVPQNTDDVAAADTDRQAAPEAAPERQSAAPVPPAEPEAAAQEPANQATEPQAPGELGAVVSPVPESQDEVISTAAPTPGAETVTVSGSGRVGEPLSAEVVEDEWWPDVTFGYAWAKDGVAIPGATGQQYTPSSEDAGHAISVAATGTYPDGTAEYVTSAPVTVVPVAPVAPVDSDGDGLPDEQEASYGTDPLNWDTDYDYIADGDEVAGFEGHVTDPTKWDTDGDRLSDYVEIVGAKGPASDPNVMDTDGGGVDDGTEVLQNGTNPTDPEDDLLPVDPTDPTDPTDPADPTDPTDPAEILKPTDPLEPTDSMSAVRLATPVDLTAVAHGELTDDAGRGIAEPAEAALATTGARSPELVVGAGLLTLLGTGLVLARRRGQTRES